VRQGIVSAEELRRIEHSRQVLRASSRLQARLRMADRISGLGSATPVRLSAPSWTSRPRSPDTNAFTCGGGRGCGDGARAPSLVSRPEVIIACPEMLKNRSSVYSALEYSIYAHFSIVVRAHAQNQLKSPPTPNVSSVLC